MRNLSFITGILVLGSVGAARAGGADSVQWRHEFRSAALEAMKQEKPLFISIHTESCRPCKEMHRTTFQDPAVVAFLNSKCIPLLVDGEKDREHMNEWRVSAFPTQMIVGTSGAVFRDVLERIEGRVGASEIMGALQRASKKQASALASKTETQPLLRKSLANEDKAKRSTERAPIKPPAASDAEEVIKPAGFKTSDAVDQVGLKTTAALALDGHCPVCMIDRAEMVKGRSEETTVYNGRKFAFASAENKNRFLKSPAKYLPGANGDCVVSLVDAGKRVAGDVKYPAMFNDKVYFFAQKQARDKFLKDPEAYVDSKGEPRSPKSK